MQKALAHFLIAALLITLLPLGCKKYPDDEYLLTFRSTLKRIKGTKKIVYAFAPGDSVNYLNIFEQHLGPFYIYFSDEIVSTYPDLFYYAYLINANNHKIICRTKWEIDTQKEGYAFGLDMSLDSPVYFSCLSDSVLNLIPKLYIYGKILKCDKNKLVIPNAKFVSYAP